MMSTSASDQHRRRAHRNRVGRAGLDNEVTLPRGRQSANQDGGATLGDNAADVRLYAVDKRAGVRVAACPPGGLAADQHRRRARAGRERRAMAGRIADPGSGLPHQLILTMPALALSDPPPLRSSEAEAWIVI